MHSFFWMKIDAFSQFQPDYKKFIPSILAKCIIFIKNICCFRKPKNCYINLVKDKK